MAEEQLPAVPRPGPASLFARNFLKHPMMLGSVIPSSRFLIANVLAKVNFREARVLVEYGPGVGTITTEILRRMRPDATLLAFETNEDFVRHLEERVRDPRLRVVHGSAAEVGTELAAAGPGRADNIISGVPFSTMPPEVRDAVLEGTRAALSPHGAFLVYQFSRKVYPHLRRVFREVRQGFEPLNILPAHLFYCYR
jgi:phospholipid N-methyltransferase